MYINIFFVVNKDLIRSTASGRFTLHPKMESDVGVFMLFPGITGAAVRWIICKLVVIVICILTDAVVP